MIGYEKIKVFYDRKIKIHVSCNGRFYNGEIIEVHKEKEFLIIMDQKIGEVPIMFDEILNLEPVREVEK